MTKVEEPKNVDVEAMFEWASGVMAGRAPDVVLYDGANDPYLERWYAVPRNIVGGVYIHHILRSDKDVLHDHPWDFTSYILWGQYKEETKNGIWQRETGQVIHRKAHEPHRLIVEPGETVVSVCFMGPRVRDWGFHCPKGWMSWQEFTGNDYGRMGGEMRGCGELS